jgi:nucleotide-binding universal stress UspA family protein
VVVNSSRGDALVDSGFATEAEIEELRGQLESAGVEFEIRRPVRGREASDEVVDAAKDVDASLIVIGMRRRTPVGKLILGSDAQRILLDAECPVLAVKAG